MDINSVDTDQLVQANKWPTDVLISDWFYSDKSNKSHVSTDKVHIGPNVINRPTVFIDSTAGCAYWRSKMWSSNRR